MWKDPAFRGVKWDATWHPDLSSLFLSPSWSSALSPPPSEKQLVSGPVRIVPPGRIHMAASLQSLSRQLLSFYLGSQPRVAARDKGRR